MEKYTAMTWEHYLEDLNEHKMYVIQFLCNTMKLVYITCDGYYNTTERVSIEKLLTTIARVLEKMNYQLFKTENKLIIIKRDADVDSVFKGDQDVNLCLFRYSNFRIEKDINEKKSILKRLSDYLEPKRSKYKKLDKTTTTMFAIYLTRHL